MRPAATAADTLAALATDVRRGISGAEATARLQRFGPNDVPEQRRHRLASLLRRFWGLSAGLIELIALLSLALGKYADFVIALALLVANALISFFLEDRASAAVTALRNQLRLTSRVLRDGQWQTLPARDLVPGDIVRVRTGDFVPADTQVCEGTLAVDQAALTGEARELDRHVDDTLYGGSVVRRGEATGVIVATGSRTYFGRTVELVASAHPKLHVEAVVSRVVKGLFLIVGVQVAAALLVALLHGRSLVEILPLSLVLLMGAVPVALPVMFTVSMAVGSVELARRGVLVTRLSAAEDAAQVDIVCADKTGTLTLNRLALAGVVPQPGFTDDDVIRDGALASQEADQDPIDLAFLNAAKQRHVLPHDARTVSFVPFSASSRRTEAVLQLDGGAVRVTKGAVRTIADLAALDAPALGDIEARIADAASAGVRTLAVARADGAGPLRFIGVALLADQVRPDSRELLRRLESLGVTVKMLTGDAVGVASAVAGELGLGSVIRAPELYMSGTTDASAAARLDAVGGIAEVYPEDKFRVVRALQAAGHVVGMTGDGVNDAPALRQAEVGIAVNGATDVARGAASVVLTREGLSSIVELVTNGRAIYQRVLTWIINKISSAILKTGFVVLPFLVTGRFVMSALAMVLLVFVTDFSKIALATDHVHPSPVPETWNIAPLVRLAAVLGLLMLGEALVLLALGWRWFGLGARESPLATFAFVSLLFFSVFSLLSLRERRWFWSSRPSATLAGALALDAVAGVILAQVGLAEMRPLPTPQLAFVIAFALVCCLTINDWAKVALLAHQRRPKPSPVGHSDSAGGQPGRRASPAKE